MRSKLAVAISDRTQGSQNDTAEAHDFISVLGGSRRSPPQSTNDPVSTPPCDPNVYNAISDIRDTWMGDVIRTVKVKLDVPAERCDDLHQTKDQFLHCANTTAEWAWRHPNDYCVTSKRKAESVLYDRLRNETDLTANLVQKGIRRAIEATKSGVARLKKGEYTSQPTFTAWSVLYDKRSATFHRDHVSLSTVNGRVECDYVLPEDPDETPLGEYLLNEDYEFRMSTLQYDRSTESFYLHARCAEWRTRNTFSPQQILLMPSTEQSLASI